MKLFFSAFICLLFNSYSYCQQDSLKSRLDNGIALHDKGEYDNAIQIYDDIIKQDDKYFDAYYEKSYSLFAARRYQECIDLCEQINKKFTTNLIKAGFYATYGSAQDKAGKPQEAIATYNTGLKLFPKYYLLYLNRGITEIINKDTKSAADDFKKLFH